MFVRARILNQASLGGSHTQNYTKQKTPLSESLNGGQGWIVLVARVKWVFGFCFQNFVFPNKRPSPSARSRSNLRQSSALWVLIHPGNIKQKTEITFVISVFVNGGQGWIRTTVSSRWQIYSLLPLATRAPTHFGFYNFK